MRLHLLEHIPIDLPHTNIAFWAEKKGYKVTKTDLFNGEELPSLNDFDWLMIMGGFQHAWEEEVNPWLMAEKKFIAKALAGGKIILGFCFGAQLLAEVLGARVFPNKHKEIGWYEVSLTPAGRESFLFSNVSETFMTFHWHSDHFPLPPGCSRLSANEATANQAFICDGHPVVGVQFHPEYTRKLVTFLTKEYGHERKRGPFVSGKEVVLSQTKKIPETYWLMEAILDNMGREFGDPSID